MNTYKKENIASELFCSVFGHNFILSNQREDHYTCKCCEKKFTMNEDGELIDLNPRHQEINSLLHYLSTKKRNSNRTIIRPLDFI